jgi:hypothetical protein
LVSSLVGSDEPTFTANCFNIPLGGGTITLYAARRCETLAKVLSPECLQNVFGLLRDGTHSLWERLSQIHDIRLRF